MKTTFTFIRFTILAVCALLFLNPIGAQGQSSHNVDVTNNVFTPKNLTINVGDTVVWINKQGFHNVNGTKGTYPSNPESFGNSTGRDWTFSHVFTSTGNYDYQCDPHINYGMVGTIEVSTTTNVSDVLSENESVLVYPNPAKNKIYIASGNFLSSNLNIQIYNLTGTIQQEYVLKNSAAPFELDVSDYSSGSYFIRIKNSKDSKVLKFIKQ